jgi:hypothetical protein
MNKQEFSEVHGCFFKEVGTPNVFIMTEEGNFVYSDPQFRGGTGVITKIDCSYKDWSKDRNMWDIGIRKIKDYCEPFTYKE